MRNLVICLISFIIALCLLLNYYIPVFIIMIAIYIWLLFKYPEIGLFLVVLVMNDFFSLFSSDVFRLPGIFRLRDVFFVSAFIPLIVNIYKGKVKYKPSYLSKAIWLIIICTVIQIALTMIFQKQGINYTLRAGRLFLYYLLYFPLVYLIDDQRKFNRFVSLIIISSMLYSTLMIIQYLIGPSHIIFQYASHIERQELAGVFVTRSYTAGASLAIIVFFFYLFKFLEDKNNRYRSLLIALLTYTGGVYLKFSRANTFGIIAGLTFTMLLFYDVKGKVKLLVCCLLINFT